METELLNLKAILSKRSKQELVNLLLDILFVYPHLADDFEITQRSTDKALPKRAAAIFDDLYPKGHLSEAEAEARMQLIVRRAEQLARQGQIDLARKSYYALVVGCVDMCRSYGSYDFFSPGAIYNFAVAYSELASQQVAESGAVIKAELDEIYRDLSNPELLDLDEALGSTWLELIEHGFVEEG